VCVRVTRTLFRTLVTGTMALPGAWHRRAAATVPWHATASARVARSVSVERRRGSTLVSWPKAALAAGWLADGELRRRSRWGRLPFGPRQRSSYQRTMNGTLLNVVVTVGVIAFTAFGRFAVRSGGGLDVTQCRRDGVHRFLDRIFEAIGRRVQPFHSRIGYRVVDDTLRPSGHPLCEDCGGFGFPTLTWHSGLLVLVLGIAGRAARLLHIRSDHGDNGVVGDASLTRAVIIQNVTKPKLALLHQTLPKEPQAGRERRKALQY
jgi:hypothetical protein